ncbi:MAG: cation-translocating P-type ATPase [[Bacteroides] pectinophilus]|nr:cation-translocating P-type ATPase [[Bacteroides] pectinophilus]
MKELYRMSKEELFVHMKADCNGLTTVTANKILEEKGHNVISESKKKSATAVFFEQFKDLLVIILIIAAVISMFSGNAESTAVIFTVIIMNAVLGTIQYVKAEKSLDSLKAMSAPHARVLRDGRKTEIPAENVVPGDVLLIEAGDMVAADGRVLCSYSLQVNESSLTGESTNVDKTDKVPEGEAGIADRTNMVYSGSLVTYGRADVLVTATGMDTEMGKIAGLMNATKEKKTPLQISLDDFSRKLAIAIMIISAIVFGIRIYQGQPVLDSLMFAVALAVAAIPEALGSIVTIVQAMGTQKMAADNAVMKELKAVESLGCVSVICSDKTGTLTQNRMTVENVYIDGTCINPDEIDIKKQLHRYLLYIAILNNDSSMDGEKGIGDPTEYCLLTMARNAGLGDAGVSEENIRQMMPRMAELPFDSDRKIMSTKYMIHNTPMILTKGATDIILERTENIAASDGVRPITPDDRKKIYRQNEIFSEQGQRVLAFAYKETDNSRKLNPDDERGYTFVGLVAMTDPPREESEQAVMEAKSAGIKTVMITGDHKVTAKAIAERIGIFEDGDIAVTGQELDRMTDEELDGIIENVSVYARVSPENKIRIVDHWQKKGRIVAMTGDGVNDAPALKKADIGIAMGITGTEVSKDAASMILTDDNFATTIKAVLNGRNVFRNIKNAIQFLLSGNMAAIMVVLYCSVAALPTPFEPVHLLFINLLTDSLPALAIGMEPVDKSLMKQRPRNPKEGIITRDFALRLLFYGVMIAISTLTGFYTGLSVDAATASTMAFAVLTLARLFHGFNCRSSKSLKRIGIGSNKWSIAAFAAGTLLLAIVLTVPALGGLFCIAPLGMTQLAVIVILAIIPSLIIQMSRMVRGR